MSHNITVGSESAFVRDLCLIREDYTVFNNYKRRAGILINRLCTS